MARIISLINQAGGVGKTTLTINLGFHLADRGGRVLLIDMDPQTDTTERLGYEPNILENVISHSLFFKNPLHVFTHNSHTSNEFHESYKVDLVPTNAQLKAVSDELAQVQSKETRLRECIQTIRSNYDFILIDCPPSLGLLSVMSLVASTHVLIPIEMSDKGLSGAHKLGATLKQVITKRNRHLRIAGAVPTMFDGRRLVDQTIYKAINKSFKKYEVHPPINESTVFRQSWSAKKPLAKLFPRHQAVKSLTAIAAYLEKCD